MTAIRPDLTTPTDRPHATVPSTANHQRRPDLEVGDRGGSRGLTRRCALLGVGGLGAVAALAACSSGSGAAPSGSAAGTAGSPAPAAGSTSSAPTTATSSPAASGSTTAGSGGGAAIAALADVPVGGSAEVSAGGDQILLSQPSAGTVEGFSPVCPHQGGQVKPDGGKFRCSLHFSEFDLTGKVTKGPARRDLTSVAVSVAGDQIVAG